MLKNKKGFTLIELLVVIAIIGLLSTLAVVSLNNARQKSRDAKRVADIKSVQTALELRYVDVENYPLQAVSAIIGVDGALNAIDGSAAFADTCSTGNCYMGNVPQDPNGTAACTSLSTGVCAYAYQSWDSDAAGGPAACGTAPCQEYQIYLYLEGDTGDLSAGVNCATETGMATACLH